MTQEVKIGVNANATGAIKHVESLEGAGRDAADAFGGLKDEARGAGAAIDSLTKKTDALKNSARAAANEGRSQIQYTADQIARIQKALGQEFGASIGTGDARRAALNFETMRSRRGIGQKSFNRARDFEDWIQTSRIAAGTSQGRNFRRSLLAGTMSGTDYARNNPEPPEPPQPPGGGGGGGDNDFRGGVQRAQSMALAFTKGMLALAGINSIMGMAGQAVDMGTEEAVGTDTTKRILGDLGNDFEKLRNASRQASEGLGLTYVESMRLSQQYAKVAGRATAGEMSSGMRLGAGFSRAYGLDPSEGVQFFGTMRRLGVGSGGEQDSRRFALMIGEAISKSGYTGKADDVLAAIADYTSTVARVTLSAPNAAGFAGMLAALTKTGMSGLDPAGAAALLGTADASMRRGGAVGDASLNLTYAAFSRYSPGMNPVAMMALAAGGLTGTTRGIFGGDKNPLSAYGLPGKLDDVTNFQKVRDTLQRQYGNNWYSLDAFKNYFGLASPQQAAALMQMKPEDLTESQRLLGNMDLSKLTATGIAGVTRVSSAHSMRELAPIVADVLRRSDLSDSERGSVSSAYSSGDVGKLRSVLARTLGTHDQEQTDGEKIRENIADMKSELTKVGGLLLQPLMTIQSGVIAMANVIAPKEWQKRQQLNADLGTNYEAKAKSLSADQRDELSQINANTDQAVKDFVKKHGRLPTVEEMTKESFLGIPLGGNMLDKPKPELASGDPSEYILRMAARQHLFERLNMSRQLARIPDGWRKTMSQIGGDLGLPAGVVERQIQKESSFNPNIVNSASGAMGLSQVMPGTLLRLSKKFGRPLDPSNPSDAFLIYKTVMQENLKANHGNLVRALLDYDGVKTQGGFEREGRNYLEKILGPNWKAYDHNNSAGQTNIGFDGEIHLSVKDQHGNVVGRAHLKPHVKSPPSGSKPSQTIKANAVDLSGAFGAVVGDSVSFK